MTTATDCDRDLYKLVRWNVNVVWPDGRKKSYPPREDVIKDCMTMEEFRTWKVAEFAQTHPTAPGEGRYVHVVAQVLRCFEGPEFDFEEDQIRSLHAIRRAISGEPEPGRRVRLPQSGVVAGALDPPKSEFGDAFFNFPPFLGQRPPEGHTFLSGWIRVQFDQPVGDRARFVLTYEGVGTKETIRWGGGQIFDFDRTRALPIPPGALGPSFDVTNEGVLDLSTGRVVEGSLRVNTVFQATTIARTDKVNRIPYAFPFIFPPLPPPEGLEPPPGFKPPEPPGPVFADLDFELDHEGRIVGLELHSRSLAPTGLFPFLPPFPPNPEGSFPAFSWGRDYTFHFTNPDRCLAGTPPENCWNDATHPDGIFRSVKESINVFFYPHLDFVSRRLREVPAAAPAPACAPEERAGAVVLAAAGKLYQIGGVDAKDRISKEVRVYDVAAGTWQAGPDLPVAVTGAQGAVVGEKLYVAGGFTGRRRRRLSGAVQVFDLETGAWHEHDHPLPEPVAEGTATAVGESIYVVSGRRAASRRGRFELSDAVQILDTKSGGWRAGAPASMPAAGASAVAVGPTIYVCGGLDDRGDVSSRTLVYEVASDQWALGPDLHRPAYQATIGRLGDAVKLAGGRGEAGGPPVETVQELLFDRDETGALAPGEWRPALPQAVASADSGAAVLGGTLYVVGGRVRASAVDDAGSPSALVQAFHPQSGWHTCPGTPAFTADTVLNDAGLTQGPKPLAPGARALLIGYHLGASPEEVTITVGGKKAPIIAMGPQVPPEGGDQRIVFQVPESVEAGTAEIELERQGAERQAPPVTVEILPASPGLYFYSFGETREETFLDRGPALACNEDGTLNFADQAAAPDQTVVLLATGLRCADPADLDVWITRANNTGRRKATVLGIKPQEGVVGADQLIVKLPDGGIQFSNNVTVRCQYKHDKESVDSNRVVISIRKEAKRPEKPWPCQYGFVFVFPELLAPAE